MTRQTADFLVVGGGPAGCAFAMLAARAGASVILAERTDYSAKRPGEHLTGRIRPLLDQLGVAKPALSGLAEPSAGIVSLWSSESLPLMKVYRAMGARMAIATVRHRFDEMLSDAAASAGVTVLRDTSLAAIDRNRRPQWHATLRRADGSAVDCDARAVVDASGRSATIARRQGTRRLNYGDLMAIVCWLELDQPSERAGTPLTVESCPYGWWSISTGHSLAVATLYTTSTIMKASRLSAARLWQVALDSTTQARELTSARGIARRDLRVFPAAPSRATQVVGDGWISIGDAAVTLDPLGGQGVAFALDTAFRAFEAACVDPTWNALGDTYRDALTDRFERHLAGRADVYAQAAGVLSESFLDAAVPRASLVS